MTNNNSSSVFSPELLGPVFKIENITLQQVIINNNQYRQSREFATFIPDILIILLQAKAKLMDSSFGILLILDITDLYSNFDKFCNSPNHESCSFFNIFNLYLSAIVQQIYTNGGDVLTFTDYKILSVWKLHTHDLIHEVIRDTIACCFNIKEILKNLEYDKNTDYFHLSQACIKSSISAGNIMFTVIDDNSSNDPHYLVTGNTVTLARKGIDLISTDEIIIDKNTIQYFNLSDYTYKNVNHNYIKVIKQIRRHEYLKVFHRKSDPENFHNIQGYKKREKSVSINVDHTNTKVPKRNSKFANFFTLKKNLNSKLNPTSNVNKVENQRSSSRPILDVYEIRLISGLKRFVNKSILNLIENECPLKQYNEMRNITVVFIRIASVKSDELELISLTHTCYAMILKVCKNIGCIQEITVHDNIVFCITFGTSTYLKDSNHCQFAVRCAWKLLISLKAMADVEEVSVGISTGMAYCMVIGPAIRRYYTSIGPPITEAKKIMYSYSDKVECDFNTYIYSGLRKTNFRCLNRFSCEGFEKERSSIFHYKYIVNPEANDFNRIYPLLDRLEELDFFDDILNEIGLEYRSYAGILIQGSNRIGKSRLLDAFKVFAREKQIRIVSLILDPSFAMNSYVTIYKILEQILEIEHCKTIEEIDRNLTEKLSQILESNELCYLNRILRSRYKLSKDYIVESDWHRHCKALKIFGKLLSVYTEKLCILLDDVHYMDYMSWQYLKRALNNKNICIAMTIIEPKSWQSLSRLEIDIYKNKHLLQHYLTGLQFEFLSTLICQFFNVRGVSAELEEFLRENNQDNPGWIELFLTVLILHRALNFMKITAIEAADKNIIFPDAILITKIASDLFPEDVISPLPWFKRESVTICLINEKFQLVGSLKNMSIKDLAMEIYTRLSIYEQDIVKCAAVIGNVFLRSTLEKINPNHQPMKTATAVENLIRLRIFECAAFQRCSHKVNDLAICSFQPRSTFSDMHHLLHCRCYLRSNSPNIDKSSRYAQCRVMEFKIPIFRQIIYSLISEDQKRHYHSEIIDIYKSNARKCKACGGGTFLRIPGCKLSNIRKSIIMDEKESSNYSISSDMDSNSNGNSKSNSSEDLFKPIKIKANEINDPEKKTTRIFRKFRIHPIKSIDIGELLHSNNFHQMDLRNCDCLNIVETVFPRIAEHINIKDGDHRTVQFMMEYASALIHFAQPGYALKFLSIADKRNDYIYTYDVWTNPTLYNKLLTKSIILSLKGKAYALLGNYHQAETNFVEALSLLKLNFSSANVLMCYKRLYEKICRNIRWTFSYKTKTKHDIAMIARQNTASCLRLISIQLMINNELKRAKLASLQSIVFGFSIYDVNNFYDQCQLYLSVVSVYGHIGDLTFLSQVEKYILNAIHKKFSWNSSDEIVMLAMLRGHLERAAHFGEKAFQLSKFIRLMRLVLEILPLLIQLMMRLQRICETVDLLQQLRDISFEDVDKSALTWYYALCTDVLLDVGTIIESYESCAAYADKILERKPGSHILRDPRSLKRLVAGLWLCQLRKSEVLTMKFIRNLEYYTKNFEVDDYSQILTLCKIFECYLLLLTRCLNLKKGNQMELMLHDIKEVMKIMDVIAKASNCIKPRYYLLKSYFSLQHNRISMTNFYLRKAKKHAQAGMNIMLMAWIHHNKYTWKALSYDNMASYWEEHIKSRSTIIWQDIDVLDLDTWSKLLYPLPIPDSHV